MRFQVILTMQSDPRFQGTAMATAPHTITDVPRGHEWKDVLEEILPRQGQWSEQEYLVLTDHRTRLIEFTDGFLDVLPMPTDKHQAILGFLYTAFLSFIEPRGGKVRFSPLRLRIRPGKFREPDLLLLHSAADSRRQNQYWLGADLALEVVSDEKPERDSLRSGAITPRAACRNTGSSTDRPKRSPYSH